MAIPIKEKKGIDNMTTGEFTHTPSDIIMENITVENRFYNGEQTGYRLTPHEGYVLHDPERDVTYEDYDEDGNLVTITEQYYYRNAYIPLRYPPETWTYHAALESTVPPDMVFGAGNNNHEVM